MVLNFVVETVIDTFKTNLLRKNTLYESTLLKLRFNNIKDVMYKMFQDLTAKLCQSFFTSTIEQKCFMQTVRHSKMDQKGASNESKFLNEFVKR